MRVLQTTLLTALLLIASGRAVAQFGGSMLITAGTAPTTPTSLTATAASASQISLSWIDVSNNETGFKIDRSPDGSTGWSTIVTTAANATSYANTALSEGTTYYYRIYPISVDGPGKLSSVVSATTYLAAPTALAATPASSSQINLSWTDNSSVETGYQVERSTDNATWSTLGTTVANATSYASTGLSACQTYYHRIKAVNSISSSAYPSSASGLTLANGGTANFTSSGSWTVPGCVTSVTVQIWGGGGAGGSATYAQGAGGGGGGGYARKVLSVTPGQVIGFSVGGGGVNGRGTGNNTAGGASSCDTMYAGGGGGGSDDPSGGVGGGGGSASGGITNQPGYGGASRGGGGGGGLSGSGSSSPGGGGAGGAAGCYCDGGNGASGKVIITY